MKSPWKVIRPAFWFLLITAALMTVIAVKIAYGF